MNFRLSWLGLMRAADMMANHVLKSAPLPEVILGIGRGGLIPAVMVAHRLKIRRVECFALQSYPDGENQSPGAVIAHNQLSQRVWDSAGAGVLVIDDIIDTGTTFLAMIKILPKCRFMCICAKPTGQSLLRDGDQFVQSARADEWVVMPWEDEIRQP